MLALAPDLPKCLIDQSQFAAAILNLVVNARTRCRTAARCKSARKRWRRKRRLRYASARQHMYEFASADRGLGMSQAVLKNIFDPFFTTKAETGTGLGLSQVSACMRLHGGHIALSAAIGRGTAVICFFPTASVNNTGWRRTFEIPPPASPTEIPWRRHGARNNP